MAEPANRDTNEMGEKRKRKRNTYNAEFQEKVGLEAIHGVKTVNDIGQAYGVHPVQVSQWKKAILEQAVTLFEAKRGPKPVAEKDAPERLYGEIGRLKMELDWLKKSPGSTCRLTEYFPFYNDAHPHTALANKTQRCSAANETQAVA